MGKSAFTVKGTVSDRSAGFIVIPRNEECTECLVEFSTYCKAPTIIRKKGKSWQVSTMGAVVLNPSDLKRLGKAIEKFANEGYGELP